MKQKGHIIREIRKGSIAEEMEIEAGDQLLAVNGTGLEDIFDYQYLIQDEYIEVLLKKPDGEEWLLEIDKEYDEDLGITFTNGLMDDYRSCHNKCIFCFIDQMPEGMRETLYFKDDDSRLSFLQGNYVTLTNMSEHDIDRIIKYHLSPINISFQTTNPELRCMMLHNRFAGKALEKVDRLYEAGVVMNGQIVLCRGVNDGEELERSLSDLYGYLPYLESVSVVPVGLSKFRDGLYPLEPFEAEDARAVITCIEKWQDKAMREYGTHFVHASDEWYILAEREMPAEESYDGYCQLENGVGMIRLMLEEFSRAMETAEGCRQEIRRALIEREERLAESGVPVAEAGCSVVTGRLSYPYISSMVARMQECFPELQVQVFPVRNDFFGEQITVTGLLTGGDIIAQLKGETLGQRLLLPQNILRSGECVLLDDLTVADLETALQVKTDIVKSNGYDFVDGILGMQVLRVCEKSGT